MASLASATLDVERGVQQRSLKIEQRQNKKFVATCFAVTVISVVSATVGYYAAVHSVGSASTHPGHGIDHNTAFRLDRAIAKAFHVSASVRYSQQSAAAGRANIKMESDKVAAAMELLKSMTFVEGAEVVKQIEETYNVDASAGGGAVMMVPGAAGAGGGADAPAAEEQTEFDVILESFPPDKKIPVLKEVRTITGLGLMEAKKFVESAPQPLKEGIPKTEAEALKKTLEDAGAVVTLK